MWQCKILNISRGAQACVLAFSCVDRESFKSVGRWKKKVEEECGNIPTVMVMTKMDLLYRADVDTFEAEKLARSLGVHLVKTSVKENINVNKVINNDLTSVDDDEIDDVAGFSASSQSAPR